MLPIYIVQVRLDIDVWPFLFGFILVPWVVIVRHLSVRFGIRPEGGRARDWLLRWVLDLFVSAVGLVAALGMLAFVESM
ncbi:hypothetical protein [Halorubrum sp. 2020YC2]|uniref:hypothetical protein n=1 Tax=Halorubrum sp. 2020YC2 TaxID=2836432 RepID=UPI002036FE40|nr:hypothetical protein [Halorubrum sp. 2020YC2]